MARAVGEDTTRANAGDDVTDAPAAPAEDTHGGDTADKEDALDTVLAGLPPVKRADW